MADVYEEEVNREGTVFKLPSLPEDGFFGDFQQQQHTTLSNERGFILRHYLSPLECKFFIDCTEKLGYSSLEGIYNKSYRNNDRVIAKDLALASRLWERISPFVPSRVEDDAGRVWRACGMNEAFRFCRYDPGGHFSPHMDGLFMRTADEKSFYTVNIYLNGGFSQGKTNFLSGRGKNKLVTESVVPETGLALVFLHDTLHEGEPLGDGIKYLMRSDVMYKLDRTVSAAEKEQSRDGGGGELSEAERDALAFEYIRTAEELENSHQTEQAIIFYKKAKLMSPRVASQTGLV